MTLAIPSTPNVFFRASANIAPSYNAGPQMYAAAGYIAHPLQRMGHITMGGGPIDGQGSTTNRPTGGYATPPHIIAGQGPSSNPINGWANGGPILGSNNGNTENVTGRRRNRLANGISPIFGGNRRQNNVRQTPAGGNPGQGGYAQPPHIIGNGGGINMPSMPNGPAMGWPHPYTINGREPGLLDRIGSVLSGFMSPMR